MISCCLLEAHRSNHHKHRDIGLEFRYRSTPNTRRVTKNVGFGGGGTIYMYMLKLSYYPTGTEWGSIQPKA